LIKSEEIHVRIANLIRGLSAICHELLPNLIFPLLEVYFPTGSFSTSHKYQELLSDRVNELDL